MCDTSRTNIFLTVNIIIIDLTCSIKLYLQFNAQIFVSALEMEMLAPDNVCLIPDSYRVYSYRVRSQHNKCWTRKGTDLHNCNI